MPAKFVDPYIDPKTDILTNLVGAASYDELSRAEGELVALRISEFVANANAHPTGTLQDFCDIHRALFQDVYSWAGCIRTVEIRKNA